MNSLEEKIYNKVIEIAETTAKQEEKLSNIDTHLAGINGKVHNHCDRIKILEHKNIKTVGIIAGITFTVSIFWAVLTKL